MANRARYGDLYFFLLLYQEFFIPLADHLIFLYDQDEGTPLHIAASKGNLELVRVLVGAGAFVDARSGSGRTPLHLACARGHAEAMCALLDAGADVTARATDGCTPLHLLACRRSRVAAMIALLLVGWITFSTPFPRLPAANRSTAMLMNM